MVLGRISELSIDTPDSSNSEETQASESFMGGSLFSYPHLLSRFGGH